MSLKPAAIPLFGDAYMADTRHLSLEEHGAYLMLLMVAWRTEACSLPDDDKRLARMLGIGPSKWAKLKPSIMAFWTLENGAWTQARLSKERKFVDEKRATNSSSAKARWEKQVPENKGEDECERMSERNAPPPSPPQASIGVEAKAPTPPRAKRAASAGTRMSADWIPGPLPPDIADLVALWPPGRFEREVNSTRDYWLTRNTKREKWDLTLHNRIRDIHDRVLKENRYGPGRAEQHLDPSGRSIGRTEAAARAVAARIQSARPPAPAPGGRGECLPLALPNPMRSEWDEHGRPDRMAGGRS